MKKIKTLVIGSAFGLLLTGGLAQASTTYQNYSLTVGAFNGSAYTSYQKLTGYATVEETINFHSDSVGGDYTVDVRGQRNSGKDPNTKWIRNVGDNESHTITTGVLAESSSSYRLQFSNDLTTPVKVAVKGKFRTN
nr:hypothetical protein [Heyndrickxia oleronia]